MPAEKGDMEEGRKGGREGGRKRGRKEGREGGREEEREREGGRKRGRKRGREGERNFHCYSALAEKQKSCEEQLRNCRCLIKSPPAMVLDQHHEVIASSKQLCGDMANLPLAPIMRPVIEVPKNRTVTALVDLMWEKIEPRFGPSEEEKEEKEVEEQEEEKEVVEQLENEDRMEELVENMSTFSLEVAAEANREQFDEAEDYHD